MAKPETPSDRLRRARELAGYASAAAFARANNIPQPTYAMHEKGTRALRPDVAAQYAELLSCSAGWLLTGEGEPPQDQTTGIIPLPRGITIAELDVRATGDRGRLERINGDAGIVDEWQLPGEFLRAQTTAPAERLRVIRVYGDSMEPMFSSGDRVLIDLSDRAPSPPGVFVVWDGIGMVIKRVEHVPYSQPPLVRLASANPAYGTYEKPLSDVQISGRVLGKWQWT